MISNKIAVKMNKKMGASIGGEVSIIGDTVFDAVL